MHQLFYTQRAIEQHSSKDLADHKADLERLTNRVDAAKLILPERKDVELNVLLRQGFGERDMLARCRSGSSKRFARAHARRPHSPRQDDTAGRLRRNASMVSRSA